MAEWDSYDFTPGHNLDGCLWYGSTWREQCDGEVVAHTPSRVKADGVINICAAHAADARKQVKEGSRPWVRDWVLEPADDAAVVRYLVEVCRAG